jgi:hypothetical protein
VEFRQRFRTHPDLPEKQDKTDFKEHFESSKDPFVTAFPNKTKDT